eukprot:6740330-Alexandrium_andersonii.AAC.1
MESADKPAPVDDEEEEARPCRAGATIPPPADSCRPDEEKEPVELLAKRLWQKTKPGAPAAGR